jgi:hypothetical protein
LPVPGTIARSAPIATAAGLVYGYQDAPVNTGLITGTTNYIESNPMPITALPSTAPRATDNWPMATELPKRSGPWLSLPTCTTRE